MTALTYKEFSDQFWKENPQAPFDELIRSWHVYYSTTKREIFLQEHSYAVKLLQCVFGDGWEHVENFLRASDPSLS